MFEKAIQRHQTKTKTSQYYKVQRVIYKSQCVKPSPPQRGTTAEPFQGTPMTLKLSRSLSFCIVSSHCRRCINRPKLVQVDICGALCVCVWVCVCVREIHPEKDTHTHTPALSILSSSQHILKSLINTSGCEVDGR